jgi:hypothetical protein
MNKPLKTYITLISLLGLLLAAGCSSVVLQPPAAVVELTTPTPEVFNPLNPSPTPSGSTLPLTCQVTDLNVYISQEWGYCFAYPLNFTLDESRAAEGVVTLFGPGLEDIANPVRASLEIRAQVAPAESGLTPLVDVYRSSFGETPMAIERETSSLGGKPAEILDPVPGLLSSRVMFVLNENILFTLRYHPSDLDLAKPDLEALSQTVTGSFAFLPLAVPHASERKTISWFEFGNNISLSYDSSLAPWVEARSVPAVPVSDQVLFAESQPSYAQIRFWGFHGGRPYELPIFPAENRIAQVRFFRTAEFPGYGDGSPQGFLNQMQALKDMLARGIDPERCAQPITGEPAMPYLPWINMKQTLCAQPAIIEFANGRGVRYLSYFSQGLNPVLDREVFYTFQGITDDGQFYVAAFFPVETGIFPSEPPVADPSAEWVAVLTEQLIRLNAKPAQEFTPSLPVLDELIQSIEIAP